MVMINIKIKEVIPKDSLKTKRFNFGVKGWKKVQGNSISFSQNMQVNYNLSLPCFLSLPLKEVIDLTFKFVSFNTLVNKATNKL